MKIKEKFERRKHEAALKHQFKWNKAKVLFCKIIMKCLQWILLKLCSIISYREIYLHYSAIKFTVHEEIENEGDFLTFNDRRNNFDDFFPNENVQGFAEYDFNEEEEVIVGPYMPLIYLMYLYGRNGYSWSITVEPGFFFLRALLENVRDISDEVINELLAVDCHDEITNEIEEIINFFHHPEVEVGQSYEFFLPLSRWEIFPNHDGRYKIRVKFEERQINLLSISNKFRNGEGNSHVPLIYSQKIRIYNGVIGLRTLSTTTRDDSIADFLFNLGASYLFIHQDNSMAEADEIAEEELQVINSDELINDEEDQEEPKLEEA